MKNPSSNISALTGAAIDYLNELCTLAERPQVTKPNSRNLTTFEHWQRYHPNYGSFQTRLFEAYEAADDGNKKKLETAFPFWFTAAAQRDEGDPF